MRLTNIDTCSQYKIDTTDNYFHALWVSHSFWKSVTEKLSTILDGRIPLSPLLQKSTYQTKQDQLTHLPKCHQDKSLKLEMQKLKKKYSVVCLWLASFGEVDLGLFVLCFVLKGVSLQFTR